MLLIFPLILFFNSELFLKKCYADDGIDLNLFHQNDYQIKFERMDLASHNKNYLDLSIVTFKYNRTTAVANATLSPKVKLGYELVTIVQAYKFMSNEYRSFPMRFSANLCKALDANVIGSDGFRRCGNFTGCPVLKGQTYHICNWYPDPSRFPPLIPNGQYRIELQTFYHSQEIGLANLYMTISRQIVNKNRTKHG